MKKRPLNSLLFSLGIVGAVPVVYFPVQHAIKEEEKKTESGSLSQTPSGHPELYTFNGSFSTIICDTWQDSQLINALCGQGTGDYIIVNSSGSHNVPRNTVAGLNVPSYSTSTAIPNYFLNNCSSLIGLFTYVNVSTSLSPFVAPTTIGSYFCYNSNYGDSVAQEINLKATKTIGDHFLDKCSNLDNIVSLPDAGIKIGDYFCANTGLTGFLSISNITAGSYFLSNCTSLNTDFLIRSSSFGSFFMSGCTSFNQSIGLLSNTTIGSYFLSGCTSFNSTIDLSGCPAIPDCFLAGCKAYNRVTNIPTSVKSIGSSFMAGATSFNSPVSFAGDSVQKIGNGFLSGCTNLTVFPVFSSSLTTIGSYFMEKCTKFASDVKAIFPDSVTSIGEHYMDGCTSFTGPISTPFNILLSKIPAFFLSGCTKFNPPGGITFPNCTSIGDGFLSGCTAFNKAISLPSPLKTIGSYFLQNCSSLNQNINLVNSVTSIGGYFMNGCNAMVSVVNFGSLPASILGGNPSNFGTFTGTAACYVTGVKIAGINAADYLALNPTIAPDEYGNVFYRKVISA